MGDKRNRKGIGLKRRFNLPGGIHSKKTKYAQAQKYKKGEYLDKVKLKHFKGPSYQIKCLKTCVSGKPRIKFIARRIPLNKRKGFRFIKDARKDTTGTFVERQETLDGSRIMNLEMLQSYVSQATTHSALCESARKYAMKGESPMTLIGEKKHGFASILSLKCNGCGKTYQIQTSKTCKTPSGDYFEINVRAVWGSMVTGGGCSSTNESLGTMGIPGISERNYSKLEEEIGDWWLKILEEDMKKAGEEERKIAIENGDHFQGVPAITVVCDGGWSKRSHKHTYNAMGGVAVIFGHRTKKLLHIGVRNRLCYICSQAQTKNLDPRPHRCFKNWNDSAQAMESDIILEGFLSAEQKYGLRFMNIISDGDSSTFSEIQNKVPVWGKFVKKLECANHACKCLRSHLEQLVSEKPQHKGKGKLTKLARVKIVTAVRCAIKMRSVEKDKKKAVTKLKTDIKNAGRHVLGLHDLCKTDFCKHQQEKKDNNVIDDKSDEQEQNETDSDIVYDQEIYWQDSLKTISTSEENNLRKGGNSVSNVDEELLKDIFFYLNRMADKSERLIGNFTSNLAESWMHIRCKFDGGKMVNKCFKSSFYGRCYGGALRSLKGPGWSPMVYQEITGEKPDSPYIDTYRRRARKHVNSIRSQNNPVNKNRKRKRKLGTEKQCSSKKAKMHYGENVLDDSEDVPTSVLQRKMKDYYEANVCKNEDDIKKIEHDTRQQSLSKKWKDERKKRLTSSIFGEVVSRSVNNNNPALVNRLLYTDFKGNKFTRKGLQQESVTIQEYTNKMKAEGQECNVENSGLVICSSHPCLAASTDGIVNLSDGTKGLIEVKNLLQNNQLLIKEAVSKQSNFCLCKTSDGSIQLKRKHKYFFQVQGQLNVFNLEWCDFVVRRTDPYDIFIERIKRDIKLWVEIMRPKLITFYFNHMLPELASPRLGTVSGIRKASVPWYIKEQPICSVDDVFLQASSQTQTAKPPRNKNTRSTGCTAVKKKTVQIHDKYVHYASTFKERQNTGDGSQNLTRVPDELTQHAEVQMDDEGSNDEQKAEMPSTNVDKMVTYAQNATDGYRSPKRKLSVHKTCNAQPPPYTNPLEPTHREPLKRTVELTQKTEPLKRPTRQRKVKFLGRRILHTWDVSTDTNNPRYKTFVGNVLSMVRGEDGDPDATYRIFYQEDNTTIDISDLKKDYDEGNLRFHDL